MGFKTLIFSKNIIPKDNLLGLIKILNSSEMIDNYLIIDDKLNSYGSSPKSKNFVKKDIKFIDLFKYKIIFGLPKKFFYFKLINIFLFDKKIFLNFLPGEVTKAIGRYKFNITYFTISIRKILSLIPYNYVISQNFDNALYFANAYNHNVNNYLPIGLPKTYHMATEFKKNLNKKKLGILFAPTHRWNKKEPLLEKWLSDSSFLKKLSNYNIYYSNHPDENDTKINDSINYTRELNEPYWSNIDIIVSDYSSIANDYLNAGRKNVIHVIPDLYEFERYQGKSPLSHRSQFRGLVCKDKADLISIIVNIKYSKSFDFDTSNYPNIWLGKILKKINK